LGLQIPLAHSLPVVQGKLPATLQAPAPSHALLPLQGGLLSVPFVGTKEHVPGVPRLHAMHVPPHAVLQQTVSTQCPLWQAELVTHGDPFGAEGWQIPTTEQLPLWQSELTLQP
jgi:hypothetical protein